MPFHRRQFRRPRCPNAQVDGGAARAARTSSAIPLDFRARWLDYTSAPTYDTQISRACRSDAGKALLHRFDYDVQRVAARMPMLSMASPRQAREDTARRRRRRLQCRARHSRHERSSGKRCAVATHVQRAAPTDFFEMIMSMWNSQFIALARQQSALFRSRYCIARIVSATSIDGLTRAKR